MKIVLWIGNEANQKALANKIHDLIPIAGIITETRTHKKRYTFLKIFEIAIEKIFLPSIGKAWWEMKSNYQKLYPDYPKVTLLDVENINSDEAYQFTKKIEPDLIVVSGTRLVKEKLLSVCPTIGILNLHTGLSPYIKGGPNCTNWCIATGQFHLIGNTIMWIDAGIDSGNIITTEKTPLDGSEDLEMIHQKVMEHAHALYVKAINHISAGGRSNVAQDSIAVGKTYYNQEWGLKQKFDLVRNMKNFKSCTKEIEAAKTCEAVKTVPI